VNKKASHYVRLFGGNKIGNLIFCLSSYVCTNGFLELDNFGVVALHGFF
jgi:hypothetical protein